MDNLLRNKRAWSYFADWPETWSMVAAALGIFVGIGLHNDFVIVLVTIVSGLAAGRLIWRRKLETKFPFYMMVVSYLIGFVIGTRVFGSFFNWKLIVFLYICAIFAGFYIYEKGYLNG